MSAALLRPDALWSSASSCTQAHSNGRRTSCAHQTARQHGDDGQTTFTLRCRVAVLDGGFLAWSAAGVPVDASPAADDQLLAGGAAAASPPASPSFRATLNVGPCLSSSHVTLLCALSIVCSGKPRMKPAWV